MNSRWSSWPLTGASVTTPAFRSIGDRNLAPAQILAAFGAIPLFILAGLGMVAFVPALRVKRLIVRLGWAFLLGVAWNGLALFSMSHFLRVPLCRSTILPTLFFPLALAALRQLRRRLEKNAEPTMPGRAPGDWMVFGPAIVGSLISAALLVQAISVVDDGYDAMMTWDLRAGYLRYTGDVKAPVFVEERWFVDNPRYPLLMPLMQVTIRDVFRTDAEPRIPRVAYAAFFPLLLLLVFDTTAGLVGRRAASVASLVGALLPLASFYVNGGAITSYSDLPLALFWGAGLALLVAAPFSWGAAIAGGFLLGAAANAKAEGFFLGLCAIGAIVIGISLQFRGPARRSAGARLLAAVIVFASCVGAYLSWRVKVPDRYSAKWEQTAPNAVIKGAFEALPEVLPPIGRRLNERAAWEGFWWVAPVVIIAGWRGLRRREAVPFLVALAGAVGIYMLAYGAAPWHRADLVRATWNRFMIHLLLPLLVLLGFSVHEALFRPGRKLSERT